MNRSILLPLNSRILPPLSSSAPPSQNNEQIRNDDTGRLIASTSNINPNGYTNTNEMLIKPKYNYDGYNLKQPPSPTLSDQSNKSRGSNKWTDDDIARAHQINYGAYEVNIINNNEDRTFIATSILGRGSFGAVYRVVDPITYKVFALKVMTCVTSNIECPTLNQIFQKEVNILTQLKDVPHMAQIIGFGIYNMKKDNISFKELRILLELADQSLEQYINNHLALSIKSLKYIYKINNRVMINENYLWDEDNVFKGPLAFDMNTCAFVFKQMVECVAVLHSREIIHTDIKFDNFLIKEGRIILSDFGVSKLLEHQYQENKINLVASFDTDPMIAGNDFTAPEVNQQFILYQSNESQGRLTSAVDIYSLGRCLLYMIFGLEVLKDTTDSGDWTLEIRNFNRIRNNNAINCMMQCLVRDPKNRISINNLLNHSFINGNNFVNLVNDN